MKEEKAEGRRQKAKGVRLSEILSPRVEKAMPHDYPEEPFLGLDDIEAHTMRLIGLKSAGEMKSSAKRFFKGDVLYSRLRPYLNKIWQADRSGLCSAEFIILPPNDLIDGEFLKYRLNARDFVAFANSLNSGDRPRVDFDQISAFCLPPFALAYQRKLVGRIEELFSEVDAGVESLKTARAQLGVYRQALLKQSFEGKLTQRWRAENPDKIEPADQLMDRIRREREARYQEQLKEWEEAVTQWEAKGKKGKKPSKPRKPKPVEPLTEKELAELPKLPEGWRWTRIGQLVDLITKGASPKWQGIKYTESDGGVLFVTSENVRAGFLNLTSPKFVEFSFNKKQPASILQNGDILYNIVGASIGRAAIFDRHEHANVNQAVSVIRFSPMIDRLFCIHHLNSKTVYTRTVSKAVDVARANLSLVDVSNLELPLCSLPEQQEIVRILEEQFSAIEQNESEINTALQRAEALRQSILKKAFSGKLVPQNPKDEPASVLLERIRAERETNQKSTKRPRKTKRKSQSLPS